MPNAHPLTMFTGDSITDAGRRSDPSGGLGAGYVRRISEFSRASTAGVHFGNTGISGNRTSDLVVRWQADVLDRAPDVLTILIGANDMWRRYDSSDPTTANEFRENYRQILERTRVELPETRIVLMELFIIPVREEQERWFEDDLADKIEVVHELANRYAAAPVVELQQILTTLAAKIGGSDVAEDGIHPTAIGHECIARAWWHSAGEILAERWSGWAGLSRAEAITVLNSVVGSPLLL